MKNNIKKIAYVCIFAIAMGFMESAIVIYLREIYYPDGFNFPLVPIPHRLALVEILREAATVVMLVITGYLAGRNKIERFAYFNIAFAVWDIFYYIFLYLCIQWPQSLFTWDILFLIPVPWVGPVWAPCLLSLTMFAGSVAVLKKIDRNLNYKVKKWEWFVLIAGACVCIYSFIMDYLEMTKNTLTSSVSSSAELFSNIHGYIPQKFHYLVFSLGLLMMLVTTVYNLLITNKNQSHEKI